MRALLSTVGSRGDVEPIVALASHLRDIGHDSCLCVPPGFEELAKDFDYFPIGHDPRMGPRKVEGGPPATVAAQFAVLREAVAGCGVIVGCAAMQIAARSIAEIADIPYFYTAYSPVTLPSEHHSPPPVHGPPRPQGVSAHAQWDVDAQWWNDVWGEGLNAARAAAGLEPVTDVRAHVITDRPLLAADPTLAPWPTPSDLTVTQTGSWIRDDTRPLADDLIRFLDAGEPPILFGFGSMPVSSTVGATMVAASRNLGRRALVLRGWAGIEAPNDSPDCLTVSETNLQALLPRVAAVVHHGGAGTTTQAMHAGVPQVVVPHNFDQPYHARRVEELGIGVAHPESAPTPHSISDALATVLEPTMKSRALAVADTVRTDGIEIAAGLILGR
ncbi:glycosyltransferase [Mycobacterium sp. NPDC051804]|uniref:glycosyltransferase n=1 Tax=Mycobacterium sp. NPDC051804 TaxID=3364295 RepID=UPI0037B2F220